MIAKRTRWSKLAYHYRSLEHASLNVELLEHRCMLTGLSLLESYEDTLAGARASANFASDLMSADTMATAVAGADGASATNTTFSRASVSTESPSLGLGGSSYAYVDVLNGQAMAGSHERTGDGEAGSSFLVECNGMLHVVMTVQLQAAADASDPGGGWGAAAHGYFYGSVSIDDVIVGSIEVQGGATDLNTSESDFEAIATGPDGALPQVSDLIGITATLSFSVQVSVGQVIALYGIDIFGVEASAIGPSIGWSNAWASVSGGIGIVATLECFPPLPPPPSPPPAVWGYGPPPEDNGGFNDAEFGVLRIPDLNGDGVIDATDEAGYIALYRDPTPLVVTTEDDELDDPVNNPAGYAFGDLSLREAPGATAGSSSSAAWGDAELCIVICLPIWMNEVGSGVKAAS